MEKSFVDAVFILDMSGSMDNLTLDVIGGYNSLLKTLKKMDANVFVTTVVFNDEIQRVHNRVPVAEIKDLTDKDYTPCGCTALLDAIGTTMDRLEADYKENPASQTLIYITTDGMENSSNEYSYKMINKMVKWHTEKDKWEIKFLAANIDEQAEGERLGIAPKHRMRFDASSAGMIQCMRRMEMDCCASIAPRGEKKRSRKA